MKVLITRPEPDASLLADLCRSSGIQAVRLPLISIRFLPQDDSAILPSIDYQLIFVSKNAVIGYVHPFSKNLCFAVGQQTAQALQEKGFQEIIYPHPEQGAAALLTLPALQNVTGQHFIVVQGRESLALIENQLTKRGAKVRRLITYQTDFHLLTATEVLLLQADYDFIIITSSNAFRYFAELIQKHNPPLFNRPVTVLNGSMLQSALHLGFTQPVIVNSFANKDLYESLRYRQSTTHAR